MHSEISTDTILAGGILNILKILLAISLQKRMWAFRRENRPTAAQRNALPPLFSRRRKNAHMGTRAATGRIKEAAA